VSPWLNEGCGQDSWCRIPRTLSKSVSTTWVFMCDHGLLSLFGLTPSPLACLAPQGLRKLQRYREQMKSQLEREEKLKSMKASHTLKITPLLFGSSPAPAPAAAQDMSGQSL
jgi:hypothetical protein